MAKHAPRGPLKLRDPIDGSNPMKGLKCTATNRQGNGCGKAPIPGGTVCRMHGGAAPQVQMAAMERLKALQPKALNRLEALIDLTEFPSVAFQASKAVIDWTEGKAVETIKAEVKSTRDMSDDELAEKAQALIAQLRKA